MTFALTKVQTYGIEAEEALNKRYRQYMVLTITAAVTDVALDLGSNQTGSLGTFWTAVSGTSPGSGALLAIQDIVTRADYFDNLGGTFVGAGGAPLAILNSGASTGGGTSETLTLTGAATGDIVAAARISTKGATATYLAQAPTAIATANVYPVVFGADPGTGAIVSVELLKGATSGAVPYTVTYANKTPNVLFTSGQAPTSYAVVLKWILQTQTAPVEYYAEA